MRTHARALQRTSARIAMPHIATRPARGVAIHAVLHGPRIQPKLKIAAANDPAEREADRVADQVMRTPEPQAARHGRDTRAEGVSSNTVRRQRAPAKTGDEKKDALENVIKSLEEIIEEKSREKQWELMRQLKTLPPIENKLPHLEEEDPPVNLKLLERHTRELKQERDSLYDPPLSQAATAGSVIRAKSMSNGGKSNVVAPRGGPATPAMEAALGSLSDGAPLPASERVFFESRFGYDFSPVRVHTGGQADKAARAVDALAYTRGTDVVFAAGQYAPHWPAGRKLLAHELTHVVQQGKEQADRLQRRTSYGTPAPTSPQGTVEEEEETILVRTSSETADIQRQPRDAGEAGPTANPPDAGAPPLATPSLNLTPGTRLTRGDTLTAAVSFTPKAGEALKVTAWRYVTHSQGTVTRAATDATFQSRWSGTMALSGKLEIDYTVALARGAAAPSATLQEDVTVNDRTGSPWAAAPTLENEIDLSGQPTPPKLFKQLGRHEANLSLTNPTTKNISDGPNTQFTFVDTVAQGTYKSQPKIHPDLANTASTFHNFHLKPSRLYMVAGGNSRLIPLTEYSGLSVTGGVTFTVPDFEIFFKKHHFFTITAQASTGGPVVTVPDSMWSLDKNALDGNVVPRNAAIGQLLHVSGGATFNVSVQSAGWSGVVLLQAPAILAGTRSHEYQHPVHSHRANFQAMLRALDPQRKIESTVSTPTLTIDFNQKIIDWFDELKKPNHELVDEAASKQQAKFVPIAGAAMAGVNEDPATGTFLGSVWNITADQQMK